MGRLLRVVPFAAFGCALALGWACSPYDSEEEKPSPSTDAGVDVASDADEGADASSDAPVDADAGPSRIYVVGGSNSMAGDATVPEAYSAALQADGTLGPWERTPELDLLRIGMAFVATSDAVVAIGGANPGTGALKDVKVASLAPLSPFVSGAPLALGRLAPSAVHRAGRLYVTGGFDDGQPRGEVFSTTLVGVSLAPWTAISTMPQTRAGHGTALVGDRMFVVGGFRGTDAGYLTSGETWTAPLESDGGIGSWTKTGSLGNARANATIAVVGDRLFVMGGVDDGGNAAASVFTGVVDAAGSITWAFGAPLPSPAFQACAVAVNDVIYVLGGYTSSADQQPSAQVMIGRVASNGGVTWQLGSAMPLSRAAFGCAAH